MKLQPNLSRRDFLKVCSVVTLTCPTFLETNQISYVNASTIFRRHLFSFGVLTEYPLDFFAESLDIKTYFLSPKGMVPFVDKNAPHLCYTNVPIFDIAAMGYTRKEAIVNYNLKIKDCAERMFLEAGKDNKIIYNKKTRIFDDIRQHFNNEVKFFERDGYIVGVSQKGIDRHAFVMPYRNDYGGLYPDIGRPGYYYVEEIGLCILDGSYVACGKII